MIDRKRVVFAHLVRTAIASCRVLLFAIATLFAPTASVLCAEGTWRDWLPFGSDEASTEESQMQADLLSSDSTEEPMSAEDDSSDWMVTSPFGNVTWPEIKMPKFEFNPPWRSSPDGEGGWLATPIAKVRSASQGAIARTRSVWNSTIDSMKFVMPGGRDNELNTTPQLAGEARQPGFWERMRGPITPVTESDDVVELMAKEPSGVQR